MTRFSGRRVLSDVTAAPGSAPGSGSSVDPERLPDPGSALGVPTLGAPPPFLAVLRNAGWLTSANLVGDILGFVLFIVLSRNFGPSGIGEYAYGVAIAGLAHVAVMFGLEDYGVREVARSTASEARQLIGGLIGAQLVLLAGVAGLLVAFVALTRPSPAVASIIFIMAIYQLSFAVARTLFIPAYAGERMVAPALSELGCRALGIVVALILVGGSHATLVDALVAYPVAGLLMVGLALRSVLGFTGMPAIRVSGPDVMRVLRIAWPFAAAELLMILYARADVVMLALMAGERATGIYASSLKFLEVMSMPLSFLGFAAYPVLSRTHEWDPGRLAVVAGRLLKSTMVVGGLVGWALFFVVPAVLIPLLGESFATSVPLLRAMAVLALLAGVEVAAARVLLAARLQARFLALQFLSVLGNIILNALLIPRFGVWGALAASIAALLAAAVLYLEALRRVIDLAALLRPALVFLLPVGVAVGVGALAVGAGLPGLSAAASLAVFLVLCVALDLVPAGARRGLSDLVKRIRP
ncbi:MAG: oligosaccharide flippase family protein [Gemmatimonadota bacterium]